MKHTGYYDRRGIPICVGDLVRCRHYRHRLRSQQMWLYFIVGEIAGRVVLHRWADPDRSQHQCTFEVGYTNSDEWEVMAEAVSHCDERGERITFNERKRRKDGD